MALIKMALIFSTKRWIIEQLHNRCSTGFCSENGIVEQSTVDSEVFTYEIGSSPISEDVYISPAREKIHVLLAMEQKQ